MFPNQGHWSDTDYLALQTNHLVELCDGRVEVLPTPTTSHQRIVLSLCRAIFAFISTRGLGEVLIAPCASGCRDGRYREPDIVFRLKENAGRIGEKYWDGADWVAEVVGEDDPDRDWVTKRHRIRRSGDRRILDH